jgi:predicted ATP-grasp superfamily ATP-dependent carboligase
MRVLVTCARSPHALAAIREFGRRGWEVTAADCTRLSAGAHSRHVSRRLLWPNLTERPAEWLAACVAELKSHKVDLLFPTFEDTFLVSRFRDVLSRYTTVLVESYDKMMRVHHKMSLNALAREAGVDVPATWQPADEAELLRLRDDLPYPVVLKLPDTNNSRGLAFCADAEQLTLAWRRQVATFGLAGGDLPMIQQKVEGDLIFTLFLGDAGRTVGSLLYEPLLMFPDGGGTAFHRRSVRIPEVERLSARLIQALGWTGFVGFDYILEKGTGRPVLIDANPRTTPGLLTGQAAGVDFTGLIVSLVQGEHPPAQNEPRPGVRTKLWFVHWLWFSFQLLPGKGWLRRVGAAFGSLRLRGFVPDIHRADDRRPSVVTALFVPYFMFVINTLKGARGGYMYGCNYDRRLAERIAPDATD